MLEKYGKSSHDIFDIKQTFINKNEGIIKT